MKFKLACMVLLIMMPLAYSQEVVEEVNPLTIIQTSSDLMIERLTLNKDDIGADPSIVMGIVEELLMPHFASNTIARKVLGKYARKITAEEKTRFSEAFRNYMIRFYSRTFSSYTNQTFDYSPVPKYIGEKKVTVKTKLIQDTGQPVAIDYKMQRSGDTWKITDIKIEGISLVISNRSQFGTQISRDGIDTVIAKLEYKNEKALGHE